MNVKITDSPVSLAAAVAVIAPEIFPGFSIERMANAVGVTTSGFQREMKRIEAILAEDRKPSAAQPTREMTSPAPRVDLGEVVAISGGMTQKGVHDGEGGPKAWEDVRPDGVAVDAHYLYGLAIRQLAESVKSGRPIMGGKVACVMIVSSILPTVRDKEYAALSCAWAIGTYTEASRLVEKVRWVGCPCDIGKSDIAEIVANEVHLARAENPAIDSPAEVLILLWRSHARAY